MMIRFYPVASAGFRAKSFRISNAFVLPPGTTDICPRFLSFLFELYQNEFHICQNILYFCKQQICLDINFWILSRTSHPQPPPYIKEIPRLASVSFTSDTLPINLYVQCFLVFCLRQVGNKESLLKARWWWGGWLKPFEVGMNPI